MPRFRATQPILLGRQRLEPGDEFETTETIGTDLVASRSAVAVEETPATPPAPPAAPAKPRRSRKTDA